MSEFDYIIDKINNAEFINEPFPHIEIKNFLSKEHFKLIKQDKQIHFDELSSNNDLYNTLIEKNYNIQPFPGCVTSWKEYIDYIEKNETITRNKTIDLASNDLSYHRPCEGAGITFRLETQKINNDKIKHLIHFLNSTKFKDCYHKKIGIKKDTTITTAIQKNLSKYEISPHPDSRKKALTYLININKYDYNEEDIYTKLLKFKDEYKYIQEIWANDTNIPRDWVRWNYATVEKNIIDNNCFVGFKPNSNPASLHAVKLNYDHLKYQRTQIYGNLMFIS